MYSVDELTILEEYDKKIVDNVITNTYNVVVENPVEVPPVDSLPQHSNVPRTGISNYTLLYGSITVGMSAVLLTLKKRNQK